MLLPTCHLINLIRNFTHIDRRRLISKRSKPKLSILAPPTRKQSADVINKCWMFRSTINLLNIWSIITLKIHQPRTKNDSHASWSIVAATALPIVIVAPAVYVSTSAENQAMHVSALDRHRPLLKHDFNEDRRELLGCVGIVYAELAWGVGAHGVDQVGSYKNDKNENNSKKLLTRDKYGMALATSNLRDWDVVAAESRNRMHLLPLW